MANTPVIRKPLAEVAALAEVPIVSWNEMAPAFIEAWEPGQHLVLLGKTGLGKSTFAIDALERRHDQRKSSICVFVTKKTDSTWSKMKWPRIPDWPPHYQQRKVRKVVLRPPYTKASTYPTDVRPTFLEALDELMEEGNWTLYLDEASYLVESLKLRVSLDELFTQARSNGITLVAGSQRPVWVSRAQLSQHSWVAAFRIGDTEDARRGGEVIGDRDRFAPILRSLDMHDFLLVNTLTDEAYISRVGT